MAEYLERDEVVNWLKKVGHLLKAEHNHKEKTELVGKIIDHIESIHAADVYTEENVVNAYTDGYSTGMAQGLEKNLAPGIRKVISLLHKEYEKAMQNPVVRDPLAYALYQTWRDVEGRRG